MAPAHETDDEIVPDPSDALEFQRIKRAKPKRRGPWLMFLVVLIGAGAGTGWYYYGSQIMAGDSDELKVIRAVEGPVKVRPETPGGMAIPDRDKLVYDRMNGSTPEPRVERLLPLPEMPKTPPAPKPEVKPEPKRVEQPPVPVEPKLLAKPQKLEPGKVVLEKQPVKAPEPVQEAKPVAPSPMPAVTVNQDMMPKQPEPTQPAETAISSLAYQIQIAAVRTREQAESEWARLKKMHGDVLAGYILNIVRVDLGADKGIFFRLRAGPIAGEDVAQALCQNLTKRKVGCLIVRPGN